MMKSKPPYSWNICDMLYREQNFERATTEEKIAFLKYAMKTIRAQMCSDALSNIFFCDAEPKEKDAEKVCGPDNDFPILAFYQDMNLKGQNKTMTLEGAKLYPEPYDKEGLVTAAAEIEQNGIRVQYFPELDFTVVIGGYHHLAAATMSVPITVKTDVFSLEPLFPVLTCDGSTWTLNEHIYPVTEVRFAIMYEFARKIWELPNAPAVEKEDPKENGIEPDFMSFFRGEQTIFDFYVETQAKAIVAACKRFERSLEDAGYAIADICGVTRARGQQLAAMFWLSNPSQ